MERHGRNGLVGLIFELLSPFFSCVFAYALTLLETMSRKYVRAHLPCKFICKVQPNMQSHDNFLRSMAQPYARPFSWHVAGLLAQTSVRSFSLRSSLAYFSLTFIILIYYRIYLAFIFVIDFFFIDFLLKSSNVPLFL